MTIHLIVEKIIGGGAGKSGLDDTRRFPLSVDYLYPVDGIVLIFLSWSQRCSVLWEMVVTNHGMANTRQAICTRYAVPVPGTEDQIRDLILSGFFPPRKSEEFLLGILHGIKALNCERCARHKWTLNCGTLQGWQPTIWGQLRRTLVSNQIGIEGTFSKFDSHSCVTF